MSISTPSIAYAEHHHLKSVNVSTSNPVLSSKSNVEIDSPFSSAFLIEPTVLNTITTIPKRQQAYAAKRVWPDFGPEPESLRKQAAAANARG